MMREINENLVCCSKLVEEPVSSYTRTPHPQQEPAGVDSSFEFTEKVKHYHLGREIQGINQVRSVGHELSRESDQACEGSTFLARCIRELAGKNSTL